MSSGSMSYRALVFLAALIMVAWAAPGLAKSATERKPAESLVAFDFRAAGDEVRTRIVMEFEQKPEFSYHLLASPHRLVVDLPETVFGFDEKVVEPRGLLSEIRYGAMAPGRSRVVFTAIGPVKAEMAEIRKNETDGTYRLVFDIAAASDREFEALVNQQDWEIRTGSGDDDVPEVAPDADKPFTVAIDPGHGGIDTGAKGRGGTQEKDITLAVSKALKTALESETDMKVVLTRNDDRFISLGERVRLARKAAADLFVSIHADSIRVRGVRGATVYTLSDKASDDMARQLAARENRSDLIAGLSLEDEPDTVADILIDLTRRETQVFSIGLARAVIDAFDGSVKLINNPIRSAGFRVLQAPEVPSVLVELGYLSNVEDEKLLTDPKWREQIASLLVEAISAYRAKVGGVSN
ncbi:N-acetylmuramoyl-L-alanine amidase [Hoeflea prorocentri]|uniref:N-acetylmuramoyl-L-alanine amidase n=3 Tax=Hoeflea prorocentri TaxID=1922333 RepID=A0A9X3UHF4_9HYPH|nr:N-acetylmuramoyl-L-alanine amidase [Hoeflea prorocentri]MDA5398690.1 N-acetylmuramoyl-L-alanine amidase [Hoeflea prorocentri]